MTKRISSVDDVLEKVESMKVVKVLGERHVLIDIDRLNTAYDLANYKGSNMALCGILRVHESLSDFKKRYVLKVKKRVLKNNSKKNNILK